LGITSFQDCSLKDCGANPCGLMNPTEVVIHEMQSYGVFEIFNLLRKRISQTGKSAQALGLDKPKGQFPTIDISLCIGCGSCVEVCPEGDVLGIVFDRATIINGQRCVGHGYCEQACPVGALKVGLGDIKTRADIPIMNEHNETSVP